MAWCDAKGKSAKCWSKPRLSGVGERVKPDRPLKTAPLIPLRSFAEICPAGKPGLTGELLWESNAAEVSLYGRATLLRRASMGER